ncbi:uncharacterized protein LOC113518824 [Galleria mellonella]|uniref:Uncharacterized protein LOC113518824 n=1 Tax=Galleria mellonella TaxID=7137 RepID=A0A6J1WUN9_GALME|nr:uncharacterized protein LOC113518824 [Galleria mellonella]XP_052748734.1 uncharacterized protein LOC113518824 [Galleria mellonella]XP_052748735.1 uncharacterized protein LOC113518824 [Galleria mellonella]
MQAAKLPRKEEGKNIEAKVKSILSTVLERCKKERDSGALQVPLDEYIQRASFYTGFPSTYIRAINSEKNIFVNTKAFSIKQIIAILECISKFYENKTSPTYYLIYETVKEGTDLPEFKIFKQEMCLMGYRYRQTKSGLLFLEDPKFSFERFHYLSKIKKLRSKDANICYIDARIINKEQTFERCTDLKGTPAVVRTDQYLFLHAISKNGYLNGLFTNSISEENFMKWMVDILLPSLNPETTIVVDSSLFEIISPYKAITRYDSKYEMIKWLKSNSIPYNYYMHKAELYELISNSKIKSKCKLDQIIKSFGHNILCLPFKLDKLTPIELLWEYIIDKRIKTVDTAMVRIKQHIEKYILDLKPAVFNMFTKTVELWENEIYQYDRIIEEILDQQYEIDTTCIIEDDYIPTYFYSVQD